MGSQGRSGGGTGKKKNLLSLPGFEPGFLDPPARSLVTILTELYRLQGLEESRAAGSKGEAETSRPRQGTPYVT